MLLLRLPWPLFYNYWPWLIVISLFKLNREEGGTAAAEPEARFPRRLYRHLPDRTATARVDRTNASSAEVLCFFLVIVLLHGWHSARRQSPAARGINKSDRRLWRPPMCRDNSLTGTSRRKSYFSSDLDIHMNSGCFRGPVMKHPSSGFYPSKSSDSVIIYSHWICSFVWETELNLSWVQSRMIFESCERLFCL